MNERRQRRIEQYYQNKLHTFELMIDNVWDPHNVAAVSRSADGLGIETIHLYYTYNEFPKLNKVGKKTSSSATKWIKFNKVLELEAFVSAKKSEGYRFLGTDLSDESICLSELVFPEKCVVILGSESKGMSAELRQVCDDFFFIPMVGMVESYNISVAAAITMYEAFRQQGHRLSLRKFADIGVRG